MRTRAETLARKRSNLARYRKLFPARFAEYARRFREKHPERAKEQARRSRQKHRKTKRESSKRFYWRHRNRILARFKKNRAEINRKTRIRYHSNDNVKIKACLRRRLCHAMKTSGLAINAQSLLGCSIESFKMYLESKFEPGMLWENHRYDGWHIDHIIPCVLFDLKNPEHQRRCFHFSNMQPLWAHENLSKQASYSGELCG